MKAPAQKFKKASTWMDVVIANAWMPYVWCPNQPRTGHCTKVSSLASKGGCSRHQKDFHEISRMLLNLQVHQVFSKAEGQTAD